MCQEIKLNSDFLQENSLSTIYFGGGSPSILEQRDLAHLMEVIRQFFEVEEDAEITLEANPDDLDARKLGELAGLGINRLSIGIQSFRDEDLKLMNRIHNSEMAIQSISRAREAGFDNLNLDLIYGIPGLTQKAWKENLRKLLSFSPEHISAYSLTFEDRTAFGHWLKKGKIRAEKDEVLIDQFKSLIEITAGAGYEHYEISNFSQPGKESRHNTSYWLGKHYLGIGPSAHSFDGKIRKWNLSNNPLYVKAIGNGEAYFETEELDEKDHLNEYLLTSLRTKWGVDTEFVAERFGESSRDRLLQDADRYIGTGMLLVKKGKLILTEKGKLVADKITSDLFSI